MSYPSIRRDYTRILPGGRSSTMTSEKTKELKQPTSSENYSTTNRVSSLTTLCVDIMQREFPDLLENVMTTISEEAVITFQKAVDICKQKQNLVVHTLSKLLTNSVCHKCTFGETMYLYGGAIRDALNDKKPNDYDIRVCSEKCAIKIINKLKKHYNVKIIRQHYIGCYSFYAQHTTIPEVEIRFDVTYETAFTNKHYDIDVNMLKYKINRYCHGVADINPSNVILVNDKCNLKNVIRHIHRNEFVVLDNMGRPKSCHNKLWREAVFNKSGEIVDCHSFLLKGLHPDNKELIDSCDCIHRRSQRGRKLLFRIQKMLKRGWTMLNEPCSNPDCVLAPMDLVEAYATFVAEKREEERRRREELRRRREEERRKREEEAIARRERRKLAQLRFNIGYIPGAVCAKTANRWSYETFTTSHKREQVKKHLTKTKTTVKNSKHGRRPKSGSKSRHLDLDY
ncbi:hypothetical protein QJ857_gp0205 [Tupanvirus soda lake]|uniref:Uncharacterized protein n=2 Tax=Tupanvirus TaxID=2094720 RepID=A0A6N1NN84_9VIRU|nr:hypothetical protein QJ857_gp0205 [Tupanvirus soda lake]QKU35819.1 hypothetical protein [Tupanvirus soda lake]